MRLAVSEFGFIIPHILQITELGEDDYRELDEEEPYSFTVFLVGERFDKIYAATEEKLAEKRSELVSEVNRFYEDI